MARRSQEDKAESRELILTAAARLFRENGIAGTSVNDVMAAAGLTHGGFYRHFASKNDLVAAAITRAFGAGLDVFTASPDDRTAEALTYIRRYLSAEHTDTPAIGCPMPALGSEIGRGPEEWKTALRAGLDEAVQHLALGLSPLGKERILALISMMVGTLVLARAADEPSMQQRLLAATQNLVAEEIEKAANFAASS